MPRLSRRKLPRISSVKGDEAASPVAVKVTPLPRAAKNAAGRIKLSTLRDSKIYQEFKTKTDKRTRTPL